MYTAQQMYFVEIKPHNVDNSISPGL